MARRKDEAPTLGDLHRLARERDEDDRAFSAHLSVDAYRRAETKFLKRGDHVVPDLLRGLARPHPKDRHFAATLLAKLEVTPTVARALATLATGEDPRLAALAGNRLMDAFERPLAAVLADLAPEPR